jgi:hypothetical protein
VQAAGGSFDKNRNVAHHHGVTLPRGASNTYYGQWNARISGKRRPIDRSIAHKGGAARGKSRPSLRAGAVSPEIEPQPTGEFTPVRKETSDEPNIKTGSGPVDLKVIRL